ncbi:MAG: magnesium/cobalt transporter CorA [Saprospirales bacterium]|nr:magnesium/cobalt transporter CorA [Saprospirales bacterium]
MRKKHHKKVHKKGMPPGTLIYTGHRTENATQVYSVWYNEAEYHEREAYVPEWQNRPAGISWVDVRSLTDTALIERVGNALQLHPLALEDVLDTQQRPKLEEYDHGLFFILHGLHLDAEHLELVSEQIAVFMGPAFVVSFQEDPDDTLQAVRKRAQEGLGRTRKKGPDYLMYSILDIVIDHYYVVLDDIESALHELESELHSNGAQTSQKARIFELKRVTSQFRHRLLPLRDAVTRLYRSDCPYIDEANRPYLRDLSDHVAQILDSIDNYRELLSGVEGLYQAEIGNRLNNVMRLLTIISTIFIPLSFIAGVYGMNFDNMPELHWHYGYFFVLGIMLTASIGMLIYFRVQRWL